MKQDNKNHNILLVSFFFAPSNKVGAKRFSILSHIFSNFFSELHVLTSKCYDSSDIDASLPHAGKVYRTSMLPKFPFKKTNILLRFFYRFWESYLCIVDPFIGWIVPSFIKGIQIVKNNNIDVIIATGPPATSIIVGYLISFFTNTTLFIDYRDPWSNRIYRNTSNFRLFLNKCIEKIVIRKASTFIFCSKLMKTDFIKSFNIDENLCHVITNGFFDQSNIDAVSPAAGKFCMIYAGALRPERRLINIIKPISKLFSDTIIDRKYFKLILFSQINGDDQKAIDRYNFNDIVEIRDRVPYKDLFKYLRGSDILFLISGDDFKYALPYKFFDYLSVKKPIFALAPENSALSEIIKEIDCGECALLNNDNSITAQLQNIFTNAQRYTFNDRNSYDWNNVADLYLSVINKFA